MKKLTQYEFIERSIKFHGTKYDYSLVNYINSYTKVKIICKEHGIFEQPPSDHMRFGCNLCSQKNNSIKSAKVKKLTTKNFIDRSTKIHNSKYNYDLTKYIGTDIKTDIICDRHGIFKQTPHHHLKGVGCPSCKESKGEKNIRLFLNKYNIKFESQMKFNDCKYKSNLFFDFFIPDKNICIEFDGEQHYRLVNFFGGEDGFLYRQQTDKIKNEYCRNNNIRLIRIRYDENVKEKLNELFNI